MCILRNILIMKQKKRQDTNDFQTFYDLYLTGSKLYNKFTGKPNSSMTWNDLGNVIGADRKFNNRRFVKGIQRKIRKLLNI